ncbi:YhgE/Pip domain-containing protein [Streptomyces sp. SL13]|uniref:YhgE/Pip domain-containing protein n=1 Tax=Streptantibioticus silvisoli TaxID=2705255 RepID=A0AA90GYC1_9ACTN|nr:YhgE/Pip domain-containing protein [Streptantibioticus silvisoli]MDI5967816.1 YhgE/Pip domain-containing protein [Streptantibioticus silvisoli]
MTVLKLAWLELRRFRGPVRRLVPALLCLIPLLYGGMYLWANWDPYGKTDHIPVAVVDQDHLAHGPQGQRVDAGTQVVQQLKAAGTFDWHFVDADSARKGLEGGKYYFTITIPDDFSADLATAGTDHPRRAGITMKLNDANNYIAGIMTEVVQTKLQDQVDSAAHAAYVRAIYGELSDVKSQLTTASKGAHGLVQATRTAGQGSSALVSGTGDLSDGSATIASGATQVARATGELDSAVSSLDKAAAQRLPAAAATLVTAASLADQGLTSVHDGTSQVKHDTSRAVASLESLGDSDSTLAGNPAYQQALKDAKTVDTEAGKADGTAAAAADTADQALKEAKAVQSSVTTVQNEVLGADDPLRLLDSGSHSVAAGSSTVSNGMTALHQGSKSLNSAADQAHTAADTLSGTVDHALGRIPPTDPDQVARAAHTLGNPVAISRSNLHPANVYGRGLAPFFFGIALWVFGLFAYLMLRPVNSRALAGRTRAWSVAAAGWLPAATLGGAGALVLYTVVDLCLGLNPVHSAATVLLLLLGVATFTAVDHCLRTALGTPGDVVSLVLLILQLTASGGLYPMPTTPGFFQALHPLLPMSYLVDGLRVTISGGPPAHLVRDGVVLAGFALLFLGLTTLAVRRRRVWSVARLHPDVSL